MKFHEIKRTMTLCALGCLLASGQALADTNGKDTLVVAYYGSPFSIDPAIAYDYAGPPWSVGPTSGSYT